MERTGLLSLPNELLLHVLNPLPTPDLLPLTTVSHRIYTLILRIVRNRLIAATNLQEGQYTLLLECYHPSAKLTEPPLYCDYLGTDGLDVRDPEADDADLVGRLGYLKSRYSRFGPHRKGPEAYRRVARPGDIPGSRTHPSTSQPRFSGGGYNDEELVKQVLSLDSDERFSQLCAVVNLIELGPRNGLLRSCSEVDEGVVRVFRDWLRNNSEPAAQGGPELQKDPEYTKPGKGKEKAGPEAFDDQRILWINPSKKNVGLRFRVRERKFRRENPIFVLANEELAVSYDIEYEELLVRTSHLLLTFEQSLLEQDNHSGKAVVFGSFG
ncbi:uncharacterized protein K452DRAFT_359207 [Aplosporella prunicola CBS 121167]|uniref:F-box domain-containing protein n=1 Tax=Aplosporella prunicola CBS 121167 TaxID=1176127 RepID=A0A6A6BDL3_9PEZI|nr:uncharacterized protein K452DRAFT_359207 [Aplosporella prunicola CBS 121167]KAF2141463.1 hypothetical protein K452DRAFT_359207 [Aplosporella prunicola CBS 121167]